jgi:hypothetical protein
LEIDD